MPIFTASGKMSENTASICSFKNAGEASSMAVTPVVFWAVSAVTALMANTPFMVMVFKSAWMPAPPLLSLPAMVSAVFIFFGGFSSPAWAWVFSSSAAAFNSSAAFLGSVAFMIADTTQMPAMGMPCNTSRFPMFRPPMALTGMGTA